MRLHLSLSHSTRCSRQSSLVGHFRSEDVNVAVAHVLLVKALLGAVSLLNRLQHHQRVASGLPVRLVEDDVALSDSEVGEEVADLAHRRVERKAADLHCRVAVLLSHVIRKANEALRGVVMLSGLVVVTGVVVVSVRLVRVEVLLALALIVASAATTTVSTAAAIAATASSVLVLARTAFSEVLAEVVVISIRDGKQLNEATTDVLLVPVVVGILCVFGSSKGDNSFPRVLAVLVFADFYRVLNKVVAVEELLDVVVGDGVGETDHLQAGLLAVGFGLATRSYLNRV